MFSVRIVFYGLMQSWLSTMAPDYFFGSVHYDADHKRGCVCIIEKVPHSNALASEFYI